MEKVKPRSPVKAISEETFFCISNNGTITAAFLPLPKSFPLAEPSLNDPLNDDLRLGEKGEADPTSPRYKIPENIRKYKTFFLNFKIRYKKKNMKKIREGSSMMKKDQTKMEKGRGKIRKRDGRG